MKTLKNILVATDFSPDSKIALDEAVDLAKKFKSNIYVLHAIERIQECVADFCLSSEQVEGTKNGMVNEAQKELRNEMRRFQNLKGIKMIPEVKYGRSYDEILNELSEKQIDLLVIGPHAKKSFWQRISTHLSDKLMRNSLSDTLIVHHAT